MLSVPRFYYLLLTVTTFVVAHYQSGEAWHPVLSLSPAPASSSRIDMRTRRRRRRRQAIILPRPLSHQTQLRLYRPPLSNHPPPPPTAAARGSDGHARRRGNTPTRLGVIPQWWDRFWTTRPKFLQQREGDFVPLEDNDNTSTAAAFGLGRPLLILCQVPLGIDTDEIRDMLNDGAPIAARQGVTLCRLGPGEPEHNTNTNNNNNGATSNAVLDLPLQEALDQLLLLRTDGSDANNNNNNNNVLDDNKNHNLPPPNAALVRVPTRMASEVSAGNTQKVAVLLFSGFTNTEMLTTYNILATEIDQETAGQCLVACAKVVPRALRKPLRQVLDEISGDHRDATALQEMENNNNNNQQVRELSSDD